MSIENSAHGHSQNSEEEKENYFGEHFFYQSKSTRLLMFASVEERLISVTNWELYIFKKLSLYRFNRQSKFDKILRN